MDHALQVNAMLDFICMGFFFYYEKFKNKRWITKLKVQVYYGIRTHNVQFNSIFVSQLSANDLQE